ncbi:MAG: hypothetical protein KDF60_10810 [Calditrichaeota bacterium]|nr:hypothetical protein [Calditrichota bacterium]
MKSIKNKYLFFLLRIWKDFINPTIWPIADDLASQELGEYYFAFEERAMENQKGGQKSIILDKDGIPMNPTYIDVKDKNFVYFPITIGQVGLAVFHTWLKTKSEQDKQRFLKIADWFYNNADVSDNLGVRWLTDVALPQYKNPGPWQSAFSQGRGISVLLRAYQMTGKKEYAGFAEKALLSFTIPVDQGGVTSFTEWGPFYEEYTSTVPTMVLNGMIFALWGVCDFTRVFPEHKLARKVFEDGIQTLEKVLEEFDLGFWSRYNLCRADWYPKVDPATIAYQKLHINQLKVMTRLTESPVFELYLKKFIKQDTLINGLRMYALKYKALKKIGRV